MDLEAARQIKALFDDCTDSEKADMGVLSLVAKNDLDQTFAALCETDRANVAWYVARVINTVKDVDPFAREEILGDSATAYTLAAIDLLGWNK